MLEYDYSWQEEVETISSPSKVNKLTEQIQKHHEELVARKNARKFKDRIAIECFQNMPGAKEEIIRKLSVACVN